MDFNDLANYSTHMVGRKAGPKAPSQGLSMQTHIAAGLSGLGEGLMGDDLYKRYSRAGGGYQNLAYAEAQRQKLEDQQALPQGDLDPDARMEALQMQAKRAALNMNKRGAFR